MTSGRCGRGGRGDAPADRPAVAFEGVELTYAEMWDRCRRLAGGLRALGARAGRPGRRASAQNCTATSSSTRPSRAPGMVLVPLNHRHADPELRYALDDSGARVLFTDRDIGDLPRLRRARRRSRRTATRRCSPAPSPRTFPDDVGEDDLAGLFYTGGTTGAPKGVMLRHRSLVANAMHVQAVLAVRRGRRASCSSPPMFHLAGTLAVLATVWHGAPPGRDAAPSIPPGCSTSSSASAITATQVVPSMLAAISEEQLARPRDVSSLRFLTFGGAPSATETLRRAHRAFPDAELMTMYGATETAPLVTAVRHVERRARHAAGAHRAGSRWSASRSRIVDAGRPHAGRARRGRRGRGPGAERDGRLLEQARRRPRPRWSTAGTTRATSAGSTTTATCTSSTARRT